MTPAGSVTTGGPRDRGLPYFGFVRKQPTTIYQLKPAFQSLLRPVSEAIWRMGRTANQVTLSAVVLSLFTGSTLIWYAPAPAALLILPPVLLARMALNAIDGMMAKDHGMKSRLGALLNELGDVVSDAALYLPLALGYGFSPDLVTIVVLLGTIGELTGVLAVTIGAGRRYDGPMGKSDRAFLFGAAGLALGLGVPAGSWQDALLAIMLLLSAITIWNRARMALREAA